MITRLAAILLLLSFYSHAQKTPAPKIEFLPGYVVTDKGDTLKGDIKFNPKKESDCYNKVVFRDPSGAQKTYKPKKAPFYGFNGQHYAGMEFESELKYYRILSAGELNFYKIQYEMISMNEPVIGSVYFISHKGDKGLKEVKEGKFKKQMTEFMKDNPDFLENYEDGKDFNPESATEVINQYNAWKSSH